MPPSRQTNFSWVELLVLIAAVALLAAIFLPLILERGTVRGPARRTTDASNLRQIIQASMIYANDNDDQLPGLNLTPYGEIDEDATTPNIHALAAALARHGGLNDGSLWVSSSDNYPDIIQDLHAILENHGDPRLVDRRFKDSALSFQYVAGLDLSHRSSTPVAWTRGLQTDGRWAEAPEGVYGRDGGHVGFVAGNVRWYRDTDPSEGVFLDTERDRTWNILKTFGPDQRAFSKPATETGAVDGLPGEGTENQTP